jgi:hypothetical protein
VSRALVRYCWLLLGAIGVGAAVFGLGSRLLMRLVGMVASPEHLAEPTAFGVVGKVTFGGTVALVIIGGIGGFLSGILYLAVRKWLPGGWIARGLALGALIVTPVGVFIVASSRTDFDLVSPGLIVVLFGTMIVVEALATAWVVERLGRSFLAPARPRVAGYIVLATLVSVGFAALGASLSDVL